MQLGELLLLGSGELKTGGFRRQSILADAFEALCGALYLDGGPEVVRARIEPLFEARIAALPEPSTLKDAKTRLQEHLQANGRPLPRLHGEAHQRRAACADVPGVLRVPHASLETEGEGPSRRRAEQVAAQAALAPSVYMNENASARGLNHPFRAGFAALVGRPNVGKSTLLNALVGEKFSIVTSRPQTTRHRVLGVLNRPGVQLAFVDTPGLHLGERRALNRAMNRTAAAALADADLVVFVVEALRFGEEDEAVLQRIRDSGRESIVVINKVDKISPKDKLLPFTAELAAKHGFLDVVPVSAEKNVNLDRLIDVIARAPARVAGAVSARSAHRPQHRIPDLGNHPREAHHGAGGGVAVRHRGGNREAERGRRAAHHRRRDLGGSRRTEAHRHRRQG